jgi:predicted MFS family arabinose efflux permease
VLTDYVPLARRSAVFAFYGLGSVVGMMLGLALAGALAEVLGWRWTFVVLGLPGIALAAIVRLTLREPVRGSSDPIRHDAGAMSLHDTIKVLWRCRTYRRLTFYYVVNGFVLLGLTQWYPSFYARTFGLSSASVGLYLGVAMAMGSALGLVLGGLLANQAARRDVRLPFVIGASAILLSLPTAAGLLFVPSLSGSMLLASVTGLLWYVPGGSVAAVLCSVVSPSMRATAGAITIFCISVFGFGLGPFCVGVLSDALAPFFGAQSLRYALLLPTSCVPAVAILLYSVTKDVASDLQAAGAQT